MSKRIVITTIYPPTAAVEGYAGIEGWTLTCVGDRKTPQEWSCDGAEYLAPEWQSASGFSLAGVLPWDHYSRKMVGYLRAIELGASVIVDADDDNVPAEPWNGFPSFEGSYASTPGSLGFVNGYQLFTDSLVWPRGLPLDRVLSGPRLVREDLADSACSVGVWQALANGDPDVDAIFRLVIGQPVTFGDAPPVVFESGTLCPFNSQNTAFRRECFPLLYLPTRVSFRYTDILRGVVAQPIMWATGLRLGMAAATVTQERNPHDLMRDFDSEVPMYLTVSEAARIATAASDPRRSITENLVGVYHALADHGIVPPEELVSLDAWVTDLASMGLH